jgi:hypothetical protein
VFIPVMPQTDARLSYSIRTNSHKSRASMRDIIEDLGCASTRRTGQENPPTLVRRCRPRAAAHLFAAAR